MKLLPKRLRRVVFPTYTCRVKIKHMKAQVHQFLTRDPKNKRGEIGSIINVNDVDEVYTLLFNDGVIGFYSFVILL
ncbi:hypothetical protein FC1_16850 [Flavobacterium columnare NBRC 100251 = ATCC 23463]|nr:hypothetical protein [Flavobacterium phage fF4]GEM58447.1 hypothetical protein FC1_16850 [Flavobacterium columnare NBRC 100251 = ATCC 23463]